MTVFYVLKKKLHGAKTPFIDDEFGTYLHLIYSQQNSDYTNRGPGEYIKETMSVRGKNCEAEDLSGHGEENQELLDTWKGFSLVCPDLNHGDGEGFSLRGNAASMISDMVRFDIVRCDNETQKKDGK